MRPLEDIYQTTCTYGPPCLGQSLFASGKSRADLWALAGIVAVEYGMETTNVACNNIRDSRVLQLTCIRVQIVKSNLRGHSNFSTVGLIAKEVTLLSHTKQTKMNDILILLVMVSGLFNFLKIILHLMVEKQWPFLEHTHLEHHTCGSACFCILGLPVVLTSSTMIITRA